MPRFNLEIEEGVLSVHLDAVQSYRTFDLISLMYYMMLCTSLTCHVFFIDLKL